eukprot:ANDGO_06508.mRNA.1 T-complex protein 1 subunit eta
MHKPSKQKLVIRTLNGEEARRNVEKVVQNVYEMLKTSFGPRGRDKLVVKHDGSFLITNDGASILREYDFKHPAAALLARTSLSQESSFGDGTTGVVLLAARMMHHARVLESEGYPVFPILIEFEKQSRKCIEFMPSIAQTVHSDESQRIIQTSLSSKVLGSYADLFTGIVQQAVQRSGGVKRLLRVIPCRGQSLNESYLFGGFVTRRPIAFAGNSQMPKYVGNPRILLLELELEYRGLSQVTLRGDATSVQHLATHEWEMFMDRVSMLRQCGATVVLSSRSIGDYACQALAASGIYAVGRLPGNDMVQLSSVFKTTVIVEWEQLRLMVQFKEVSYCSGVSAFSEQNVGEQDYLFFKDSTDLQCSATEARFSTIVLFAGNEILLQEAVRCLDDALSAAMLIHQGDKVVDGGGQVERLCAEMVLASAKSGDNRLASKCIIAYSQALQDVANLLRLECTTISDEHRISEPLKAKLGSYQLAFECFRSLFTIDCVSMPIFEEKTSITPFGSQ